MRQRSYVVILLCLLLACIGFITIIRQEASGLNAYLEYQFTQSTVRPFLTQVFKQIPPATPGQKALVLTAEVIGDNTIFLLEKGYDLIAVDSQLIGFEFIAPPYQGRKVHIDVVNRFNFEKMPNLDLVMAHFFFPFYDKNEFKKMFDCILEKLKPGGYFIGNFFDPGSSIFDDHDRKQMTFHTKQDILKLFENWDMLTITEVKKPIKIGQKKSLGYEHYYEVFAKRKKSTTVCNSNANSSSSPLAKLDKT